MNTLFNLPRDEGVSLWDCPNKQYPMCTLRLVTEGGASQFIVARFDRDELLLAQGLLDVDSGAVVWALQNTSSSTDPEVIR